MEVQEETLPDTFVGWKAHLQSARRRQPHIWIHWNNTDDHFFL